MGSVKWKKVFLKEKVSKANWLSLFTEPFSPAGRVWFKHHILLLYLRLQCWMKDMWCYFEKVEKFLSVMSRGMSKETLWILIIPYQGIFGVLFLFHKLMATYYFPTALRNQAVSPVEEDDVGDEEDTSTVRPHTGSTTASQNGKSSLRYFVITSSPANMPGQWPGPGRTAGHSTSMCPVLFITLHSAPLTPFLTYFSY